MDPNTVTASRVLMGDSLGFHIIFVIFGLALPIFVSWFEFMGLRRKDKKLLRIAKFWSKIMGLLVIVGVISGTIIALQMSLVWPGILKFGGEVIGLPFMFETYAFLIEAVFLALYLATWDSKRINPWLHWIFGLFIILGSTLSAFAITSVNAWMNYPTGFEVREGQLVNISVWDAMFSKTSLVEFFHSMPGYYFAAALTVSGLYAAKLLTKKLKDRKSPSHKMDWFILQRLMLFAACMFILSGITADITGKYLAKHEPVKLAAIELQYETQKNAPLLIGGVAGENQNINAPHFKIPSALSVLAGNSPNTEVKGLNEFPKEEHPPLYIHTLFDIKMTIITVFVVLFIAYFLIKRLKPQWKFKSWFLFPISISGLFGIILVELGWMLTEIGRQPWAVRGYLTTQEALTKTHDVTAFGYLFPLSYLVLFAVTILALIKLIRDEHVAERGKSR